jgi:hypothetical protein
MSGTCYVYAIFRPDGWICYIGKGKGNRWESDKARAQHNRHFAAIWKKAKAAGQELPRIKIREHLTDEQAFEIEIAFIAAIGRRKNGGPLTNMTDGGDGLLNPSPETRKKMSLKAIERMKDPAVRANVSIKNTGKKIPLEVCIQRGMARRGEKHTPEHNAAISAGNKGKKLSPEHCAAISAGQLGKSDGPHSEERCKAISKGNQLYWERWRNDPAVRASRTDRNGSYPDSHKNAIRAGLLASHDKRKLEGRSILTKRTIRVIVDGKETNLFDACRILNIDYDRVRGRIRSGRDPQLALGMG